MLGSANQDQGCGLASGKKNLLQLPQALQLTAATPQPDVKPDQDYANHHTDPVRVSRSNQCLFPALGIGKRQ